MKFYNTLYKKRGRSGMTLIEILVVIAIIAIISTIGFLALRGGTRSADDAKRITNLKTIQTAVEKRQVELGHYPQQETCVDVATLISDGNKDTKKGMPSTWEPEYDEDAHSPADKDKGETGYYYVSDPGGTEYRLIARLEDVDHKELQKTSQKRIKNISVNKLSVNRDGYRECDCNGTDNNNDGIGTNGRDNNSNPTNYCLKSVGI